MSVYIYDALIITSRRNTNICAHIELDAVLLCVYLLKMRGGARYPSTSVLKLMKIYYQLSAMCKISGFTVTSGVCVCALMHLPSCVCVCVCLAPPLLPAVFHPVECSYCHTESMMGFRYRCQQCHNYQLCQDCFWRGHASGSHSNQHQMKEYTSWVRKGGKGGGG